MLSISFIVGILAHSLISSFKSYAPYALPIGACATLLTVIALYFATPSSQMHTAKNENILLVGMSGDFPPFTFFEKEKLVGFDVDLVHELAHVLNKKIEIKNMPFTALLPSLQAGTIHIIASGLTATPERAQRVLFTQPYLANNKLVIVSLPDNGINTIDQLHNKDVIVNEGYTADLYLSALPNVTINIKRLKTVAEAFLALESKRAVAFVTAESTVKPFFDQYGAEKFTVTPVAGTDENASIAIALHLQELQAELQKGLDILKENGTITTLKNKWKLG